MISRSVWMNVRCFIRPECHVLAALDRHRTNCAMNPDWSLGIHLLGVLEAEEG